MSTPATPARLLVVDDEPDLRTLYELTLLRDGHHVETAGCVDDALLTLAEQSFDAVITDMRLPDGSGLDVLKHIEAAGRREKTIVITAFGSADNAVEALKAGAFDYLTKPVDLKQFRSAVASALATSTSTASTASILKDIASQQRAAADTTPAVATATTAQALSPNNSPNSRASNPVTSAALSRLVGPSAAIQEVRSLIEKVSRSMAPVLLWGESGTGKELVARAIHDVSVRRAQPFIAVNCGAIPEHLLEAEFFGYRKGAFTGAQEDREGFFQAAQGGTLFLDEIGDLPLAMQSKLLRAVQERAVRPVGAVTEMPVDVRIISASHKDLAHEVSQQRFRQDLFYRLNVILIALPALRNRLADLPMICEQLLYRIAIESGLPHQPSLSASALAALQQYAFPGNVRELENILHRAVALSGGHHIEAEDLGPLGQIGQMGQAGQMQPPLLPQAEAAPSPAPALPPAAQAPGPLEATSSHEQPPSTGALPSDLVDHLDNIERDILVQSLEQHKFNRTAAGASLGLSLRQMRYRMARLGIQVSSQGILIGERGTPEDLGDAEAAS